MALIFHTMFPFYMGINETKYGWMDEGWATIGEWVISPIIDPTLVDTFGVPQYEAVAGKEADQPIITLTTQLSGPSFEPDSYGKPALGYLYVRDLLGDSLFTKALHYYIEQWHGKHPMPYDFFNCMNVASGQNLNWFWKSWFFDGGIPDQAIKYVTHEKYQDYIVVANIGTKPIPIDIVLSYSDGSTQKIHRTIAEWKNGDKTVTIITQPTKKHLQKVVLGGTYDPDVNKNDNVWIAR